MAQEYPLLASCPLEDLRIRRRGEPHVADTHHIQVGNPAPKAADDPRVEVLVGCEPNHRRRSAAPLSVSQELLPEGLVLGPGVELLADAFRLRLPLG